MKDESVAVLLLRAVITKLASLTVWAWATAASILSMLDRLPKMSRTFLMRWSVLVVIKRWEVYSCITTSTNTSFPRMLYFPCHCQPEKSCTSVSKERSTMLWLYLSSPIQTNTSNSQTHINLARDRPPPI